jgi:hypothetical protein
MLFRERAGERGRRRGRKGVEVDVKPANKLSSKPQAAEEDIGMVAAAGPRSAAVALMCVAPIAARAVTTVLFPS